MVKKVDVDREVLERLAIDPQVSMTNACNQLRIGPERYKALCRQHRIEHRYEGRGVRLNATGVELAKILELHRAGQSLEKISRSVGRSPKYIRKRLIEKGEQPNFGASGLKRFSRKQIQEALRKEGTCRGAAKRLGTTVNTLKGACRREGIPLVGRRIFHFDKEALHRLYVEEERSDHQIAKIYGCSSQTVANHRRRAGIASRPLARQIPRGFETQLKWAAKRGLSLGDMARKYGYSRYLLKQWIPRLGISYTVRGRGRARVHVPNDYALHELDPFSSYAQGFILTDGSIDKRKGGQDGVVIGLQRSDRSHLVELARRFGVANPENAVFFKNVRKVKDSVEKIYESAHLSLTSQPMVDVLESRGIVANKTYNLRTDLLPQDLLESRDFWRGCIDGDGSIALHKPKNGYTCSLSLCSHSRSFMELFVQYVAGICRQEPKVFLHNNSWGAGISGEGARKVLRRLYHQGDFALERKARDARKAQEHNLSSTRDAKRRPTGATQEEKALTLAYIGADACRHRDGGKGTAASAEAPVRTQDRQQDAF